MRTEPVPTPTSRTLAVVLGCLALVLVTISTGLYQLVAAATVAGVLFALAGVVNSPDQTPRNVLTSVVFVGGVVVAGFALLRAFIVAPTSADFVLSGEQFFALVSVLGVCCSSYGLTVLLARAPIGTVTRSLVVSSASLSVVLCGLFGLALLTFRATALGPFAGAVIPTSWVVSPQSPERALVTLCFLLGITVGAVAVLLKRLPVPLLVSKERQPVLRVRIERGQRVLLGVSTGLFIFAATAFILLAPLWTTILDALPRGAEAGLLTLTTAREIRVALLLVTGVTLSFVFVIEVLRRVRPESIQRVRTVLAHSAIAFLAVFAILVVGPEQTVDLLISLGDGGETLADARSTLGALPLLLGLLTVTVALPTTILAVGMIAGAVGLLTQRTATPVITAAGLTTTAVTASVLGEHLVLHVFAVALAFVVWDIGTYGQQLGVELGQSGRRVELVHAGAVTAVGTLSVGVVYGILWATDTLSAQGTATTAFITFVGLVLVLGIARA